jgi:membrane protein insertase Oxa1/YidC/SpoIIIJ
MIELIWHDFLYQPLLNLLILIYNNYTNFNLGLAVIYLTILLRLVLLPFTFVSERDKLRWERLNEEIKKIKDDYKKDPVLMKEIIRETLKKYRIRPWAKTVVLGVQLLVLIVLYQVFLGGLTSKFDALYPWIIVPDFVNLNFLPIKQLNFNGFHLATTKDLILPTLIGIILYFEIYFSQKARSEILTRSDMAYRLFFPLFSFFVLYYLPTVKSVFILTSIFFSIIISLIAWPLRMAMLKANKKSLAKT